MTQYVVGTRYNRELEEWVCMHCGRPPSVVHVGSSIRFQSCNIDICNCGEGSSFEEAYKKVKAAIKPLSYYDHIINPHNLNNNPRGSFA